MKDIKIISITYSLTFTNEIIKKIVNAHWAKGRGLSYELKKASKGHILSVEYKIGTPKIFIQIKIDNPKEIKPEGEIWQLIERVINQHIE